MTTPDRVDSDAVADSLRQLGATDVVVTSAGDVDFKFGELKAFAYSLRPTGFRISFVLAFDPPTDRAEAWIKDHADVTDGFVRIIGDENASNLLFTVDVENEATDLNAVVDAAFDLVADWNGEGPDGIAPTLADAGLLRPPLGTSCKSGVRTYGPWWWGTRRVDPMETLYMFDLDTIVSDLIAHGPFFAMSHAGHGLNSYGLNVVTAGGPFAVFFQHGFGGVYMSPLRTRLAINEAYSYLHVLLDVAPLESGASPRWLLAYSEFRGVCGLVDLDGIRAGRSVDDSFQGCDNFEALIGAAAKLAPADEEFGAAGVPVQWPPYDSEDI